MAAYLLNKSTNSLSDCCEVYHLIWTLNHGSSPFNRVFVEYQFNYVALHCEKMSNNQRDDK